jgi:hypothetical protein
MISRALVLLLLPLASAPANAQTNRLFAVHNQGGNRFLATVNTSTAALSQVGAVGFTCDAIAFAPDGRLFAADNSNFQLVVLNTATAAVDAVIGPFNDFTSHVERMSFHPITGVLYGLDSFNFKLVTIDTGTGQISTVGPTGAPPTPSGLSWSLDGTKLYLTDLFDGCLYVVNPSTGATTRIGCGDAQEPYGLATDGFSGQFYAVERHGGGSTPCTLATVNIATGARSVVGTMVGGPEIEDISFGPSVGTRYCQVNANSTGSPARIAASGSPSSAAANLTLAATSVPDQTGIFFHGANQIQTVFGNGFLCVSGGLRRGLAVTALGKVVSYTYNNSNSKRSLAGHVGSTRNFQYWFRDPMAGGAAFNTSDAIAIGILP